MFLCLLLMHVHALCVLVSCDVPSTQNICFSVFVGATEKLVKMVKWWGNTIYIIYDYNYYMPFCPSSSTLLYSQETLYSISYIYI